MTVKSVLFDLEGTLVQCSARSVPELFAQGARRAYDFAKAKGYAMGDFDTMTRQVLAALETTRQKVERTGEEVIAREVVRAVLKQDDVVLKPEDWAEFELEWYRPFVEGAEVTPGTEHTLMSLLEHGAKLGILTNNWWGAGAVAWGLEQLDLWEFFDQIFVSSELGWRKPSPRAFEIALKKMGCPASATLFVGDDPVEDIEGAQAAGLRTLLFGTEVKDMETLAKRIGGMMI